MQNDEVKEQVVESVLTDEQQAKLREIATARAAAVEASSSHVPRPRSQSAAGDLSREPSSHRYVQHSSHPSPTHPHAPSQSPGLRLPSLHELRLDQGATANSAWAVMPTRKPQFFSNPQDHPPPSTQRSLSKAFVPVSRRLTAPSNRALFS